MYASTMLSASNHIVDNYEVAFTHLILPYTPIIALVVGSGVFLLVLLGIFGKL
ncbi:hypothetical protein CCP3SC15_1240012 [Gammaproteobacteria bacterium]